MSGEIIAFPSMYVKRMGEKRDEQEEGDSGGGYACTCVFDLGHLLEVATHGPFQGSGFKILREFHPENISLRLKSMNHAIILISISVT